MTATEIIEAYSKWHPELGIDPLLEYRKELSIRCSEIANIARQQRGRAKTLYMERKIAEATTKLSTEGTAQFRESTAITENKQLRLDEAISESKAHGAEIVLHANYKVLDSMASYIKIMTNI